MSSETYYKSLKVSALKELLQKRFLPVRGKKEDMVARLLEADKSDNDKLNVTRLSKVSKDDLGDLAPPEDEIDWEDDTTDIPIKSTLFEKTSIIHNFDKLINSKKNFRQNNPQKIQKDSNFKFVSIASIFSTSSDSINNVSIKENATLKNVPSIKKRNSENAFDMDWQSIENEIVKRKIRASRFGISENENNKRLERSIRFNVANTVKLDYYKNFSSETPEKNIKFVKSRILNNSVENEKIRRRVERFGKKSREMK
ncbi:hypothetical protein PNEG_01381 [Pneumocystis murina B123]|uniref:SAP domain-containing protein n=1 Tax=Pneumocystis murina (strain B123) TaxID=1069680 RepID=M7NS45_PNEMU|nr:hypothetical protein PNEG_01381 [Pneumocystis murina B123]EMR10102.1 hypothetical protein PNEG_01381 [Pneumocystis murina B123]